MTREWKPGDVALVTSAGETVHAVFTVDANGRRVWVALGVDRWLTDLTSISAAARPLVVIDPEDREQVAALYAAYVKASPAADNGYVNEMQAALRSLVTPPRPTEPAGLGAVVEDDDKNLWVRCLPDGGPAKWCLATTQPVERFAVWSSITAVKVLSEGVTP